MNLPKRVAIAVLAAAALASIAGSVRADVTVIAKYQLIGGDTLTRASYYTSRRARVTAPDGREYIYDASTRRVSIIDHKRRIYWTGPIEQADSIATKLLYQRRVDLKPKIEANRERWEEAMKALNDSIKVQKYDEFKKIATYTCTRWTMTAGRYMTREAWLARGITVNNYAPELEKVMMASVLDPLGRALVKLVLQTREQDGLPLGARTTFQTFTQKGSFAFRASEVRHTKLPLTVFDVPRDYKRITL